MSKRRGCTLGCGSLLLLVLAAAAGAAWLLSTRFLQPHRGWRGAEARVVVEPGSSGARILGDLERAGVLADARIARLYLVHRLGDPSLHAGEYVFREPLTGPQVLDKLVRGQVETRRVTLIEGLTVDEAASRIAEAGFGPLADVRQAVYDPSPILDLDPEARDLEGYLFPETYQFAPGTAPRTVVRTIVDTFRRHHDRELAALLAGAGAAAGAGTSATAGDAVEAPAAPSSAPDSRAPGTLRELVTLASIVEKEARLAEESPVIAGVYRNRLDRGIALYADPTVIYALQRLGRWDGNLRRPDLQLDSPYNTYRYAGLPPGPICSPGLAALRAAARPADVPYLYFVSRNDGTHVFARTLVEHNRNVEEWQRRYWRERRKPR